MVSGDQRSYSCPSHHRSRQDFRGLATCYSASAVLELACRADRITRPFTRTFRPTHKAACHYPRGLCRPLSPYDPSVQDAIPHHPPPRPTRRLLAHKSSHVCPPTCRPHALLPFYTPPRTLPGRSVPSHSCSSSASLCPSAITLPLHHPRHQRAHRSRRVYLSPHPPEPQYKWPHRLARPPTHASQIVDPESRSDTVLSPFAWCFWEGPTSRPSLETYPHG